MVSYRRAFVLRHHYRHVKVRLSRLYTVYVDGVAILYTTLQTLAHETARFWGGVVK